MEYYIITGIGMVLGCVVSVGTIYCLAKHGKL